MNSQKPDKDACCHLCAQIAGDAENDLLQAVLASPVYVRRVALEDDDFAVIPSLGALVEGHVLVAPRRHARSFAQLATPPAATEAFLDRAKSTIEEVFESEVQMFEHGTAAASKEPACSVEHAHVHLMPCRVDLLSRLGARYRWTAVSGERELIELVADGEYLRLRTDGSWMVTTQPGGFPSQLLRQELAQALPGRDADGWNWRTNPRPETVARTFRRLSATSAS